MMISNSCHLCQVGHHKYLMGFGQTRQALGHGVGSRATNTSVNLIEHQNGRALSEDHTNRQHGASQFPSRSDFAQWGRWRSGVGRQHHRDVVGRVVSPYLDTNNCSLHRQLVEVARNGCPKSLSRPFTHLGNLGRGLALAALNVDSLFFKSLNSNFK